MSIPCFYNLKSDLHHNAEKKWPFESFKDSTAVWTCLLDLHVGPKATARSAALSVLVSFLVESDVFISAPAHAPCLTTDAMFIHDRKRTASPRYPLQTSPWLPFCLRLQLSPHNGRSASCPPASQIYIRCGDCDTGGGKHGLLCVFSDEYPRRKSYS